MSNKLTIILTIKDRVPFTIRWMRYMNDMRCPYKILIADGGADQTIKAHLEDGTNYSSLRYEYVSYPFDSTLKMYLEKQKDISNRVMTEYILFADNDDFFILDRIPEYISFLENNEQFVACGGSSCSLYLYSNNNVLVNSPCGDHYILKMEPTIEKSIIFNTGIKRISHFLEKVDDDNLWPSWYHIVRTKAVQKVHAVLCSHDFQEVVAFEIYVHMALLNLGGYKEFPSLFYIRQIGTSQLTSEISKHGNLVQRFIKKNAFSEIHNSLSFIDHSLSESDRDLILNAFTFWFLGQVKKLYFPPIGLIDRCLIYIVTNCRYFYISYILRRFLVLILNQFSNGKTFFIREKIIEEYILKTGVMSSK